MPREVRLGALETVTEPLTYPIDRAAASEALADVTLVLADDEANLGTLIDATASETFAAPADIETALHTVLPRGAVGEPYQSEGDA